MPHHSGHSGPKKVLESQFPGDLRKFHGSWHPSRDGSHFLYWSGKSCQSLGSASNLKSYLLSAGEWARIVLRGKAEGAQEDRGGAQVLVASSPITLPAPPPPPGRCPFPCPWPVRVWSIPLNFTLTRNASFVLILWGLKGVPPHSPVNPVPTRELQGFLPEGM